ncbi:hypothetical protein HU830_01085 [Lactobacillus sp. DCY120]|uniref:Uncharacterized protein n=1 Tax=Bombilactobacillus apium TaxID=2675299 RepID=A0A850QYP0_9LACO|nr:hypothetical protein [Bombilactobacillus apium]NVY95803.1 hypothetical protein [Bombilactobacillus apium]
MTTNKLTNNNKSDKDNKTKDQILLDEVKSLPESKRKNMLATMEMYSGPIPHPKILKGYDGAAKEIIENGVNESVLCP